MCCVAVRTQDSATRVCTACLLADTLVMCKRVPSPPSSELMLLRATAYQMAGDFYNAIADCGRVLKADKSNMKAYEVSRVACVVIKLLCCLTPPPPLPSHRCEGEHTTCWGSMNKPCATFKRA